MVFSALEFQRPSPLPMKWTMMLHFRVQNYCIAMKSTEVLNPWRNDIDRQKACSHPQTDYIHCGDTFLRCIIIALNGEKQTSRSRET